MNITILTPRLTWHSFLCWANEGIHLSMTFAMYGKWSSILCSDSSSSLSSLSNSPVDSNSSITAKQVIIMKQELQLLLVFRQQRISQFLSRVDSATMKRIKADISSVTWKLGMKRVDTSQMGRFKSWHFHNCVRHCVPDGRQVSGQKPVPTRTKTIIP